MTAPEAPPLLLYDGECGLCDRAVQFLLARDPGGALRFAPLQGETAGGYLERHGLRPRPGEGFDSMVLALDPGGPRERVLVRAEAALALGRYLGGGLGALAWLGRIVPRRGRDAAYRVVARNRKRLAGPPDRCRLPDAGERARFLP